MKENFTLSMPAILSEEGGYSNNKKDPGGSTNLGITIGTLSDWLGHKASVQDVKDLTPMTVTPIYKKNYWDTIHGDDLPAGLDYAVFDFAVNSGPARAVKILQQTLGLSGTDVDGIVGSQTITAASATDVHKLIDAYVDARIAWLKTLSTFSTFGKGWTARCERVRSRAHTRASDLPVAIPPQPAAPSVALPVPEVPQSPKAESKDVSLTNILSKPEALAPLVSALAGFGSVLSGTGPVQYALAGVLVASVATGLYLIVKRRRATA